MPRRFALAVAFALGCGGNVDLGGSADAAPADAPTRDSGEDARACGALSPPNVPSPCVACARGSATCQQNGCYDGYYCDTLKRDCQPPPVVCIDDGGSASDAAGH